MIVDLVVVRYQSNICSRDMSFPAKRFDGSHGADVLVLSMCGSANMLPSKTEDILDTAHLSPFVIC